MSQKEIGFAILGSGMVAEYHQQAIEANRENGARLLAIGHHDPERFDSIAQRFGVPCRHYDALLSDPEIDVIAICTPSGQHAKQAVRAAEAGKHVLVEKPMALSLADADSIIESCRRQNVRLGVVLQRRAEPLFRRVKDALEAGDLGRLTLASITMPYVRDEAYYDQAEWRGTWSLDGGGVLMNQGIHIIDLLVWFMGDPVATEAFGGTLVRKVEVEDTAGAVLHFEDGAVATIAATTTADPGFPHRIEIYGSRGGIQIEGESILRWTLADPESGQIEPWSPSSATEGAGAGGDPRGISASGHIAIVSDFIEAIRSGVDPAIDGAEGRRSLAAVLGIYQAAGLGVNRA